MKRQVYILNNRGKGSLNDLVSNELYKLVDETAEVIPASYGVYAALLTQSGTDAPVATVLQNTTGTTVTFLRTNVGMYRAVFAEPILTETNFSFMQGAGNTSNLATLWGYFQDNSQLLIDSFDLGNINTTIQLADGILINQFIEIRIYN